MKRFRFRLERVQEVRRIQKQRALGEYALAQAEETAQAHRLDDLRAAASAERTGMQVGDHHSNDDVHRLAMRASMRAQAVQIATADLAAAAAVTAERAEALRAAARKTDILDRLSNKEKADWLVEARRAEANELDDIAGQRAGRAALARARGTDEEGES